MPQTCRPGTFEECFVEAFLIVVSFLFWVGEERLVQVVSVLVVGKEGSFQGWSVAALC
jgi:hypothetical protein